MLNEFEIPIFFPHFLASCKIHHFFFLFKLLSIITTNVSHLRPIIGSVYSTIFHSIQTDSIIIVDSKWFAHLCYYFLCFVNGLLCLFSGNIWRMCSNICRHLFILMIILFVSNGQKKRNYFHIYFEHIWNRKYDFRPPNIPASITYRRPQSKHTRQTIVAISEPI